MGPLRRSIKTRLLAIFALLLTAALVGTAALTYHLTRAHLDRALDDSLLAAAASFEAGPGQTGGRDLAERAETWLAQQPVDSDSLLAVRVGRDRVLATESDLEVRELVASGSPLIAREPQLTTLWWAGGIRVLAVPLEDDGRYAGTFVAASRQTSVDATLRALLTGVGWAGAAGLLMAIALAAALVIAALRPLERIAASAAAIESTGDLSRRVSPGMSDDEVGRLGRAFDAMLERLQRSFGRQQTFLSDAAHEIRTPLTIARGQLEWLQDSLTSPDEKQVLAVAVEEIDRVDRTVEDMLLLARLDEGATLMTEPVDVDLVMSEAALRAMTLSGRSIAVEGGAGVGVRADARRLGQVIDNLLGNALKHAGEDAAISISARVDGDVAAIDLRDTGKGIPEEHLPNIFDRHFRTPSTKEAAVPGAGLGLAIARSLMEAMGGSIEVASTPGSGTTFTLRLPLVAAIPPTREAWHSVRQPR